MERIANLIVDAVKTAATLYTTVNMEIIRRDRPYWALVYKYEGETIYHCNGHSYVSNAQNLAIIPRGCSYAWKCVKEGHYAVIEFQSRTALKGLFTVPVKNGEYILKLFKNLEYKRMERKPYWEMESIRDVYSLLLEVAEQAQKVSGAPLVKVQKLAPAMEYISQNYNRSLTNDELAQMTGFSTVYFRKLFTEVYGTSPIAYAKNLRIKMAREMLSSDYATLTDVALSLGYANIFDFSRDFKKRMGISPSKYQSAFSVGNPDTKGD